MYLEYIVCAVQHLYLVFFCFGTFNMQLLVYKLILRVQRNTVVFVQNMLT